LGLQVPTKGVDPSTSKHGGEPTLQPGVEHDAEPVQYPIWLVGSNAQRHSARASRDCVKNKTTNMDKKNKK